MREGAVGVVSVAANLIPAAMAELPEAMLSGITEAADAVQAKYGELFTALLKLDTNPVPIKAALSLAGLCDAKLRLPMVEMDEEKVDQLKSTLESLVIIS